jgi:hypothetical protein
MARREAKSGDPIQEQLRAIREGLEDFTILICTHIGMKRDELRRIVPVNKTRIGRIMKQVNQARKRSHGAS